MTSIGLSTSTTLGQGFTNYVPLIGLVIFIDANTYKTVDIPLSSFTFSSPDAGMADAAPAMDSGTDGGADGGVLTGLAAVQQVEIRLAPTGGSKVWRIDDISATNVPVGECKVAADCNDNNACTTESCAITVNGGVCHHANVAADTVCRAAVAGGCDIAEVCAGDGTACPADMFEAATTACGSATTGECDMADMCSGTSAMCNPNHVAAGTACATGTCGANGTCVAPPPPAAGGTGGMPAAGGTGGTGGTPVAAGGTPPVAMGGNGGTPVVAAGGSGGTVVDVGGSAGATTAAAPAAGDSGGCGCSIPGKSQRTNPATAAIGLGLLGWMFARRRRHSIG
jgi:MYXO-CTERM domain-containing protein